MVTLLLLATAGQVVLLLGEAAFDAAHGGSTGLLPRRIDIEPNILAAQAYVHGHGSYPWYGDGKVLGFAPQYTILLAPLGLLPLDAALAVCWLVTVLLLLATLLGWVREAGRLPSWTPAILLSIAVLSAIRLDQMMAVIGLAAISLAVWAQRRGRWGLAGVAMAVGLARTSNALPILVMLLVAGSANPRLLLRAAAGGAAVLLPLTLLVFAWDGSWIADYQHNLAIYNLVGPVKLAHAYFGDRGTVGLELVACTVAAVLAWPCRGRPLSLDRVALTLAVTVVAAIMSTFYVAIYTLPALARVARRPDLAGAAWMAAIGPWAVIVLTAPASLDPHTTFPTQSLTAMVLVLVAMAYPLARHPDLLEAHAPI